VIKVSQSIPFNYGNSSLSFSAYSGATVRVLDQEGEEYVFLESNTPGIYHSSSLVGQVGDTYILRVIDLEGNVIESSPQTILPNPGFDSLYAMSTEIESLRGSQIVTSTMASFLVDLPVLEQNTYLRYDWEMTYEFTPKRSPSECDFDFELPERCYRSENPNNYENVLRVGRFGNEETIVGYEVALIDPNRRMENLFSLLVNQYRISHEIYEYRAALKNNLENNGGLFDPIPARLRGNLYYQDNQDVSILGYFEASSVFSRRIFILPSFIRKELEHYACVCQVGDTDKFLCTMNQPTYPDLCCDCRRLENSTAAKPEFWP
jgi:hypothetical protein